MKKKIVWLVVIVYHTNKVNAKLRFIRGRITKIKKTGEASGHCIPRGFSWFDNRPSLGGWKIEPPAPCCQ